MAEKNSVDHDVNLEKITRGREANALAGLLRSYIDERITLSVHQMAVAYRNKEATHDFLLGKTAEIACMLNMQSDLDGRIRLGAKAAEKEMGNGQEA
jgi:hypothetical protein